MTQEQLVKYFTDNIEPICTKIDIFLGNSHFNYADTLLALASILGTKLREIKEQSILEEELAIFIEANLTHRIEKEIRENN